MINALWIQHELGSRAIMVSLAMPKLSQSAPYVVGIDALLFSHVI